MRAKGVVVGIKGTILMIDLKPQWRKKRVFVKEGEVVVEKKEKVLAWDIPSEIPKEGSVVRLIWHNRDSVKNPDFLSLLKQKLFG